MPSKDPCGIIPPRRDEIIGERSDGYLPECILPKCHRSEHHLFLTPEGEYIKWEDDINCGCFKPEEEDRSVGYFFNYFATVSFEIRDSFIKLPFLPFLTSKINSPFFISTDTEPPLITPLEIIREAT